MVLINLCWRRLHFGSVLTFRIVHQRQLLHRLALLQFQIVTKNLLWNTGPRMMGHQSGMSSDSKSAELEKEAAEVVPPTVDKVSLDCCRNVPRELSFVSRLNCTTGKVEWVELPDDYDFHQEIARSAYADMLHDHDRNIRYFEALRFEIAKLKDSGKPANVLDIGTGTGLLSMMAVVAGADAVFACDAFTPMLECARKVVKRNGFEGKIKLIPKRSTELVVGQDIPFRCNILVTEVFDTELIGEGAIGTFNHAHKELLVTDAVVIPASSTVYAQVVHSPEVERWNSLPSELDVSAGSVKVQFPSKVSGCPGIPSVQDLQLDAIQRNEFTPLSPPLPIFTFDFTTASPIPTRRSVAVDFKSETEGKANALFLWWDLDMDTSGKNVLSCQPSYVRNGPERWFKKCAAQEAAWRDHWMHSVYYIPRSASLEIDNIGTLQCSHDEYAFWFDVGKKTDVKAFHPVCECGVHTVISRSQFYMMNDKDRYENFIRVYRNLIVPGETTCLCISDCSILPVILAKLGAAKVFVVETCPDNERVCKDIVQANQVDGDVVGKIVFVGADPEKLDSEILEGKKIDLVTGDPHFHVAVYPWNNLMFWYLYKSVSPLLLSPNVRVAPKSAMLRGAAVHFEHLWKIHAPVGKAVHMFDLADFDELISHSSSISDCPVDAQPLWEYGSIATSEAVDFLGFDLSESPHRLSSQGVLKLCDDNKSDLKTNGIAIWIDWKVDDETTVSTGPKQQFVPGEKIVWERHSKQGVYFIEHEQPLVKINFTISFDHHTGDISFTFQC